MLKASQMDLWTPDPFLRHMIKLFDVYETPYYVSLTIAFRAPDLEKDLPEIPQEQLPRCKKADCNGLLRPYIVWFGENLHEDALSKASKSFLIKTRSSLYIQ